MGILSKVASAAGGVLKSAAKSAVKNVVGSLPGAKAALAIANTVKDTVKDTTKKSVKTTVRSSKEDTTKSSNKKDLFTKIKNYVNKLTGGNRWLVWVAWIVIGGITLTIMWLIVKFTFWLFRKITGRKRRVSSSRPYSKGHSRSSVARSTGGAKRSKLTNKQLAALAKGRAKRSANLKRRRR